MSKSFFRLFKLLSLALTRRTALLLPILLILVVFAIYIDYSLIQYSPLFAKALSASTVSHTPELFINFFILFSLSTLLRVLQSSINIVFTQSSIHDLSRFCFSSYIFSSYANQKVRSLSSLLTYLNSYIEAFSGYLSAHIQLVTSSFSILAVLFALISFDPLSGLSSFALTAFFYVLFGQLMSPSFIRTGKIMSTSYSLQNQYLKEAKSGLRYTFLDQMQKFVVSRYSRNDIKLRKSIMFYQIFASLPRNLIELVALFSIVFSLYTFNNTSLFVSLSVFVVAAQRLLPVVQQAYSSWAVIKSNSSIADNIFSILRSDLSSLPTLPISINTHHHFANIHSLQLIDTSFSFPSSNTSLFSDLSLYLEAGSATMLSGPSGSGKSTLLDILLCLQDTHSGRILINDFPLNSSSNYPYDKVAYIPQEAYFFEGTLRSNVVLNQLYDDDLFQKVMRLSCFNKVANDLTSLPIHEDGSNLSGGQRQRLAIARALYKNPDFFVLDECTSALNQELEFSVIRNILDFNPNAIVLCVTHNLNLAPLFDNHYTLNDGTLVKVK